jgi:hypothetical protein
MGILEIADEEKPPKRDSSIPMIVDQAPIIAGFAFRR